MSDSLPPPPPNSVPPALDEAEEIQVPDDPEALAADRAGFKFLAVGFAIFFVVIVICASIVALAMKRMGI